MTQHPPPAQDSFAAQLRRLRQAAGLTQEQLADRAGLTPKGISALERGDRQRPYLHTVLALAGALELSDDQRSGLVRAARPQRAAEQQPSVPLPAAPPMPVPLTPLLGRDHDVAAITSLLAAGSVRLLTLLGPGGVGKTRLAQHLAAELADQFRDGVAFVTLASLHDPALVLPSIAAVLQLREVAGQPLHAVVHDSLRTRQVLLVLDNFEHLMPAASDVAALLAACPELTLLVTSRAPLRIRREQGYAVQPLAVPPLAHLPTVPDVAVSPSVQMFVDRARAAAPGFALTQSNAAAIAAICRRLNGLPLAIELAAARVRLLAPTALLARLDRALPLLTRGARDVPERQQTMRGTIQWSYDLLDSQEQALFHRLSVFVGAWTLEAVEALEAQTLDGADATLDLLSRLVEQSLVVADLAGDESRYWMLEPVREYAQEQLEAVGETDAVREWHARVFLRIAEQTAPKLWGHSDRTLLHRLAAEYDNLRAALHWSLSTPAGAEIGLRLAASLARFWYLNGDWSEGRSWLERALEQTPALPPAPARATALHGAGRLAHAQTAYAQATTRYEASLQLYRELGDQEGMVRALYDSGSLAQAQGDYARAVALGEECLRLYRAQGNTWGTAHALYQLGVVALEQGDYGQAVQLGEESLPLFRRVGTKGGIACALNVIGLAVQARGDWERAAALHEEALALCRETSNKDGMAWSLRNLGAALQQGGDMRRAAASYAESLVLRRALGDMEGVARGLEGLAGVAVGQGRPDRAARLLGAAHTLRETSNAPLPSTDRAVYEQTAAAARAALGSTAFSAAWAEGKALPVEQTATYALEGAAGPLESSAH